MTINPWRECRRLRAQLDAISELKLDKFEAVEDKISMQFSANFFHYIADIVLELFHLNKGINFIEMKLSTREGKFALTVQKCSGLTPNEMRLEAEYKVRVLERRIAELEGTP